MSGPNGGGVLVVDDDPAFRAFLVETLSGAGYATSEAGSGREATLVARRARPSLVILDLKLPDISGHEVCRRFRDLYGEALPIVVISGVKTDDLDRVAGLLVGADDYLAKPIEADELLAHIRRVALRSGALLTATGPNPVQDKLTPREQQVLQMLADGLAQNEIAAALVISPKTVGTHLQRIMSKLEVHSRAQAVAVAHRFGDFHPVT
ncbi:MAG TPA: response regulator transcription factor [Gaiellaceae bacterium]|jgi:DNA-binding NarL/FixJ family response regulator|nr:response regulator transcription factor [Gaiellaceae bacterium]